MIDTRFYHDKPEPVMWTADKRYVRCAKCGVIITQTPNGICHTCRKTLFDWRLENFAKFWENIDYDYGMQLKLNLIYSEPCDCGSSVCDECNPGWDQDSPMDDDDYESWMDYV